MVIFLLIISFSVIKEFAITFQFLNHYSAKLLLLQSAQIKRYILVSSHVT